MAQASLAWGVSEHNWWGFGPTFYFLIEVKTMALQRTDVKWVRGMFGISPSARDRRDLSVKQPTNAEFNFADTTLGGNAAINPLPQFTVHADLPTGGLLATNEYRDDAWFELENSVSSQQMGRVYHEIFDSNQHLLHLRACTPKYSGTITFFSNMYDRNAAKLARDGEYSRVLAGAGKAAGIYLMFAVIPLYVFVPLIVTGSVLSLMLNNKPSKYYYGKPAMDSYLRAYQLLLDTMLIHYRLVPMWDVIGTDRYIDATEDKNKLKTTMEQIYKELPDVWKSSGKFDVYRMLGRYQTLANYQAQTLNQIYNKTDEKTFGAAVRAYFRDAQLKRDLEEAVSERELNLFNLTEAYASNPQYLEKDGDAEAEAAWLEAQKAALKGGTSPDGSSTGGISADGVATEQEIYRKQLEGEAAGTTAPVEQEELTNDTFWAGMTESTASAMKDGMQFMSFRVNAKDEVSDSFTNSTREPEISSSMNSLSAKARSFNFSTSGGKTGFDMVDSAISGVKDFIGGMAESVHLTGLAAIYGASYVDIPDVWDASEADVGTLSYNIQLRSPYGDDFSIFTNIIVPLCGILAFVLPLATGKQTHTSPFLVEAYNRGKVTTRLGMVTAVNVTRGTGNLGWRPDGKPLAVDVSITIKDLSRVVTMPIMTGPSVFDNDNKYTDYLATLGAASLHEMVYGLDKLALNLNKWKQSWKSRFMVGRITNDLTSIPIARFLANFTAGTVLK